MSGAQIIEINCGDPIVNEFVKSMYGVEEMAEEEEKILGQLNFAFSSGRAPIYATLIAPFTLPRHLFSNLSTLQLSLAIYAIASIAFDWNNISLSVVLAEITQVGIVLFAVFWLLNIVNISFTVLRNEPLLHAEKSRRPIDSAIYEHERTIDLNDYYSFNTRCTIFQDQTIQFNIYVHSLVHDFTRNLFRQILSTSVCLFLLQLPIFLALSAPVPNYFSEYQLHLLCSLGSVLMTHYGLEYLFTDGTIASVIGSPRLLFSTLATLGSGWLLIDSSAVLWFLWSAVCRAITLFNVRVEDKPIS